MNLIEQGPHHVADTLRVKLRVQWGVHALWVAPSGAVTIRRMGYVCKLKAAPPDRDLVGLYTRAARCDEIRDDLAERLLEIQG